MGPKALQEIFWIQTQCFMSQTVLMNSFFCSLQPPDIKTTLHFREQLL